MNYPTRPIEWLHSVQCQAKAVIAAVENLRDTHLEARADTRHLALDMRVALQENMPLQWADEYLASGTTQCICPEPWPDPPHGKVQTAIDQALLRLRTIPE